jgi:murein DD-endopeptidase MepM/ murein hydrolase activator NlpD
MMRRMKNRLFLLSWLVTAQLLLAWLLAACAASREQETVTLPAPNTASPTLVVRSTTTPTSLPPATQTPTPPTPSSPTPTPTQGLQLCSPLEGIPLERLTEQVVNPFHPPAPGSDDPHQGVDLADISATAGGENIALAGRAVQAVLEGTVAMVIYDRFPYGNALLVETPLENLPQAWLAVLQLPTPAPTLSVIPALTCPQVEEELAWDTGNRSLYLLYAHLKEAVTLQPEDTVSCGMTLGMVGNSGNAINPHLHLEARLGPTGVRMSSMAHYDNRATLEEMHNYCVWRVSGLFQLVDPMSILGLTP